MKQGDILALTHLHGFRWIPLVNNLPAVLRLPTLIASMIATGAMLTGIGVDIERTVNMLIAVGFMMSTLTLWIIMAVASQQELTQLAPNTGDYVSRMIPTARIAWVEFALGLVAGIANLRLLYRVSDADLTLLETLTSYELMVTQPHVYAFAVTAVLLVCWGGVVTVHLLFFLFRHYRAYMDLARNMPINLFDLEACQLVSRPLLRYWFLVVIVITLYLLTSQFAVNAEAFALAIVLPLLSVLLLLSWLFFLPVWVVRERIRGLKLQESERVKRALLGEQDALSGTHIEARQQEFSMPDLLYYLDHIASIWEWPIQQEMQRLAIYTLIPPLAWIMAALVERMLDSVL